MKTHDYADAMVQFAGILKAGPNVELSDFTPPKPAAAKSGITSDDVAVSLRMMGALSQLKKDHWRHLISDWKIPITVLDSDSKRDLIGRLLRFLEDNPNYLRETAKKGRKTSPELMKVLSILMGENGGDAPQAGEKE